MSSEKVSYRQHTQPSVMPEPEGWVLPPIVLILLTIAGLGTVGTVGTLIVRDKMGATKVTNTLALPTPPLKETGQEVAITAEETTASLPTKQKIKPVLPVEAPVAIEKIVPVLRAPIKQTPMDKVATVEVMETSAAELAKAYQTNELTADATYRNKRLRITGYFSIHMFVPKGYSWRVDNTEPLVVCEFSSTEMTNLPLRLLEKALISVDGTCQGSQGRNAQVWLDKCSLVTSQADLRGQLQELQARADAEKERADDELEARARTEKPVRPHPSRGFLDARGVMTFSEGTIVEMVGMPERIREIGDEERYYYTTGKKQQVNAIGGETTGTLYEVTLYSKNINTRATCYFRAKYREQMLELKNENSLKVRGTVIKPNNSQSFELKWCVIMP